MAVVDTPPTRKLRVYAYDPQASRSRITAAENIATIALPWAEAGPDEQITGPGPCNGYIEVIDHDPVARVFYRPLDLDDPLVIADGGVTPSEGNPQFHQQMAFAVVMRTIKLFERALGRPVRWRGKWDEAERRYVPVDRLRVYPHALREPNAFYSIDKTALMFGCFQASKSDPGHNMPGGAIFTVLSHDIIVHETTHAILDGLHRRFSEPTHPDTLAFHEAMADTVALLSRLTLPEVVAAEIRRSKGSLAGSSLLSQIGRQVGEATGRGSALRDAFDLIGPNRAPDPTLLASTTQPHRRGAILVAAVFEALIEIYDIRTADLLRIANVDPNLQRRNALHPDLVERLTREAVKSADHVLRMCIRALDYMPPVDPRFGDFLRALVTADADLVPDDRLNYRLCVIEAFRRRGIFPEGCSSMAPDALVWQPPQSGLVQVETLLEPEAGLDLAVKFFRPGQAGAGATRPLTPAETAQEHRRLNTETEEANRRLVHQWLLTSEAGRYPDGEARDDAWARELGIFFKLSNTPGGDDWCSPAGESDGNPDKGPGTTAGPGLPGPMTLLPLARASGRGQPTLYGSVPLVEVHSVRMTRRTGPDGQELPQLVISVTQRRRAYWDLEVQTEQDSFDPGLPRDRADPNHRVKALPEAVEPDFWFRGGATLIIDLRSGKIRYVIRKRIDDDRRLNEQRAYLEGLRGTSLAFSYGLNDQAAGQSSAERRRAARRAGLSMAEPFALMHRGYI